MKNLDNSKTKWELFSDYGMKILNETFATKREAQRALMIMMSRLKSVRMLSTFTDMTVNTHFVLKFP